MIHVHHGQILTIVVLNRTATNQTGTIDKSFLDEQSDPNHMGGFDFLLANDVDLSNPVVQAEQLNQNPLPYELGFNRYG